MTTEKIMDNLLVIAEGLNAEERDTFEFIRKNKIRRSAFSSAGAKLGEFYVSLEDQLRTETARKNGKAGVKRGMESVLKSAQRSSKPWIHYAYDDGEFQVACDGYMIAALSKGNHVPLSERPDREEFKWALPNWKNKIPWESETADNLVELPELSALKLYLKSEKLKRGKKTSAPIVFDFGKGLPYIKLEFLIAAMEILPNAKAYCAGYENLCLFLKSDNGSVVYCMGIEPSKNKERIRTEI